MSDPNDNEPLAAQLKLLRSLYERGELSKELYDAALVGLGADLTTVFDQRGQRVHRQINVAGNYIDSGAQQVIISELSSSNPTFLRNAYLKRVAQQSERIPLSGVDVKEVTEQNNDLQLTSVYTPLTVLQIESDDDLRHHPVEIIERDRRALSVLEVLNREQRLVLLGEPGSGKSTFVNFVALCLAGEALGFFDVNLAMLTAPLNERQDRDDKPQLWRHGALLPVRIVLRDLVPSGLPEPGQPVNGVALWNFIVSGLGEPLKDFVPHLRRELMERGGLILLDGLDEVPDAQHRRVQVKQAVQDFATMFPRCRFLVTSRTYAYQQQDWKLTGFVETVLSPFTREQIAAFVDRWYTSVGVLRGWTPDRTQERATLLKSTIAHSARLQELAERPLLLTLMASLHAWRGVSLPEKREELYADAVDLLLYQWERAKVEKLADGSLKVMQPSLVEWLKVDREVVRAELERLAFEAHRDQPELVGTADIQQGRLFTTLLSVTDNEAVNHARLLEYMTDRAGLITARGEGVYAFPHRSFQEYLAACYLTDHNFPDDLASLARAEPNRWREVVLLASARVSRGSLSAVWLLVDALCPYDWPPPKKPSPLDWNAALCTAQIVVENHLYDLPRSEKQESILNRVHLWLLAIDSNIEAAPHSVEAREYLRLLGDLRPQISSSLEAEVVNFFTQAQFAATDSGRYGLLMASNLPLWSDVSPLYVGFLQNSPLDLDAFLRLCIDLSTVVGDDIRGKTMALVIEHPPKEGDLHQVFALRANRGLTTVPLSRALIAQARMQKREIEVLREQIDLYRGRSDLFDATAVSDILSFFGRKSLLADLQQQLVAGKSVLAFGMRKIGKSSLLARLTQECNWLVAHLDMQGFEGEDLEHIYGEILLSWQAVWEANLPSVAFPVRTADSARVSQSDFKRSVTKLLKTLSSLPEKPGLLVFIDEVEYLQEHPSYIKCSAALRSIAESSIGRDRFAILVTGLDPSLNRVDRMNDHRNPWFNFFSEKPLGPLELADAKTMIISIGGQMGIGFADDARELIVELTGGHPFLTRQICSYAIKNLERPGTVDRERAKSATERYLSQADNYMAASLWGMDSGGPPSEEAGLLKTLALKQPQNEGALLVDSSLLAGEERKYRMALQRLEDQSLIRQEKAGWVITISIYRNWIRRYIIHQSD